MTQSFAYIANSNAFKMFMIAIILLAGIVVGIQTYEQSSPMVREYAGILNAIDSIILFIFTLEAAIKILAEGKRPWRYFNDPWNVFDFVIVAVCYLAYVLPEINSGFVAVLRLARILRVFKLVTALPKLQVLVSALLKSIPSMFYISVLLFLLFYIYAAMGVFLFGKNDPVHFLNLQRAMLSLFRVITLEDWTDIMYINMYGCNHEIWGYSASSGCVAPEQNIWIAQIFFISFVLMGTMIVLNLFIGVIMNAMDEASTESKNAELRERTQKEGPSPVDQLVILTQKIEELKTDIEKLKIHL